MAAVAAPTAAVALRLHRTKALRLQMTVWQLHYVELNYVSVSSLLTVRHSLTFAVTQPHDSCALSLDIQSRTENEKKQKKNHQRRQQQQQLKTQSSKYLFETRYTCTVSRCLKCIEIGRPYLTDQTGGVVLPFYLAFAQITNEKHQPI